MFKVAVDDIEYEVNFIHFNPIDKDIITPGTECYIHQEKPQTMTFYGSTVINRVDQYNRNIGRKLSLARALKDADFSKDVRELFWNAYFKMRGGKS